MKRLEEIKGKIIEIPVHAKRYIVVFWEHQGWNTGYNLYTTPEDAAAEILNRNRESIEYYTVIEVELPIPISK